MKLWTYYQEIKCSNNHCKKNYLQHKYGIAQLSQYDNLVKQNSWYICKGCHLAFYCSRKCQKID
ncbi:MAG: hypothetical protein GY772_16095 [bacterium]|nr:hypothetical protein [bacterium]MCP5019588.1 hypothetical protein [Ketobacter sp.]